MASLPPAVRRLCLVVDVEGYSTRGNPQAVEIQNRLLWSMWHACRAAGVDPRRCDQQDRGDGQLILLPPAIDEAYAVPRLLLATQSALHRVNRRPQDVGRMRLRAALAQSPVHKAATGYVGDAVIHACRMLDSPVLRHALASSPEADVAALVGDDVYRGLIAHGYAGMDPRGFRRVEVNVPDKGFSTSAYLYLPRSPADRSLVPAFHGVERLSSPLVRVAPWAALGMTAGGALFAAGHLMDDPEDDEVPEADTFPGAAPWSGSMADLPDDDGAWPAAAADDDPARWDPEHQDDLGHPGHPGDGHAAFSDEGDWV
ncbi:hypothetical protein [Microbispora sp. ATCC PTA-5024]|uniref:hypothetical protein n=1 Tax=Microbispora sp. ATCC PTA-5024 TaxID=316330 RepID=UPI0003DBF422|nr:hypothetical protein [Microbispora sp. ATCC PTA-5024]ETK35220.1 hypothetical protein MPTA5024_15275 [Microbispora sp. ATCC PTA-5024]